MIIRIIVHVSYRIYINGTLNETTASTTRLVLFHNNGTYLIAITAVNASGESSLSKSIMIIIEIPPNSFLPISYLPDVPLWITGNQTIRNNNLIVSWNEVKEASFYRIYVNGSINETTTSASQLISFLNNSPDYLYKLIG